MTDLERARIVIDNLANRVGGLTAENLELLVRIHELEQAQTVLAHGLPETGPETGLPPDEGAPS